MLLSAYTKDVISKCWVCSLLIARDAVFPSYREEPQEALWQHATESFAFSHSLMIATCLMAGFSHLSVQQKNGLLSKFSRFFLCATIVHFRFTSKWLWLLIFVTGPLSFLCWISDSKEVLTFHFLFLQFLVFQITYLPAITLWTQAWAPPLQVRFFSSSLHTDFIKLCSI